MKQYEFIPRKLLGFCQQVALGMQYLSTKGFVHRDLATRNILLSEGEICKVSMEQMHESSQQSSQQ